MDGIGALSDENFEEVLKDSGAERDGLHALLGAFGAEHLRVKVDGAPAGPARGGRGHQLEPEVRAVDGVQPGLALEVRDVVPPWPLQVAVELEVPADRHVARCRCVCLKSHITIAHGMQSTQLHTDVKRVAFPFAFLFRFLG